MRVVREIQHPHFKITLFHWNNRYLLKLESGLLEQTFKVSEFDVTSEAEVEQLLDDEFLKQAADRFTEMAESLAQAQARHF